MEYGGFAPLSGTSNYNYKFNGIERVESFNLDFAFYRGLDPVLGLWMQVDPKAEAVVGMYPYCAMGNNPISQVDPKGDLPFLAVAGIGFASGVIFNGINNYDNGENFWSNGFKAGLWSAAGSSISFGIGGAFGELGSIVKEFGRAGAHALAQGSLSHLQGGNFWQGAASGGLSSIGGSGMQALGFSDGPMIFGSSALGGLGSKLAGGDFFKGFAIGLAVGAFNHAIEHGIVEYNIDIELREAKIDGNTVPDKTMKSVDEVLKLTSLARISNKINPKFIIHQKRADALGVINPETWEIELGGGAFRSYRLLASTVYHELIHLNHLVSGMYAKWANTKESPSKSVLTDYSELRAHSAEKRYSGLGNPEFFINKPSLKHLIRKFGNGN